MDPKIQTALLDVVAGVDAARKALDEGRKMIDPAVDVVSKFPVVGQYASTAGAVIDGTADLLDVLDDKVDALAAALRAQAAPPPAAPPRPAPPPAA